MSYNPNRLIDALLGKTQLRNDVALARMLEVAPSVIAKVRHHRLPVGASLLMRMHDLTGISVRDLRVLMGDRRVKYRLTETAWTDAEREERLHKPTSNAETEQKGAA